MRSLAVDEGGRVVGWKYREFPQHYPRPGWVEHDPEAIWAAVVATLGELVEDLDGAPVAAIGITNQRETSVLWDRDTGEPLAPAIVWQDRRTAPVCDRLRDAGHTGLVRRKTGLVLDPYFSATKVSWLLTTGGVEPRPSVAFGTVDSWLVWKLTGGAVHATDPSNASRTLLYDIRALDWSEELCELFDVPVSVLPEVLPSCGRFGVTTSEIPCGPGVPVSGILGDQQAALFGQACLKAGMAKNTYGTGSFILVNMGHECPDPIEGLLTTVAWTVPTSEGLVTHYALEGSVFVTGAAVQWLRDGMGFIEDASAVETLAASVPDSGGVVFVPAFTGLGSPWWDPYARGLLIGLTRGVTKAHIARATLEAIAFQTRDVVETVASETSVAVDKLRVDGGASRNHLLLQIQADQLGVPVQRPVVSETTAYGAALMAGLAERVWSSLDEVGELWRCEVEVSPSSEKSTADRAWEQWRRAVERSRGWASAVDDEAHGH